MTATPWGRAAAAGAPPVPSGPDLGPLTAAAGHQWRGGELRQDPVMGAGGAPLPADRPSPARVRPTPSLSPQRRLRLLAEVALFRELNAAQLAPLAGASEILDFEPGEPIVRQGEPGDSVYVIVAGQVQVLARIERGGVATEAVVSYLGRGDALGELSLLDAQPRSASGVALSRTTCLRLGREAFLHALEHHWPLARALLGVLAARLRDADARLAEHARDPLTGLYSRGALAALYEREAARCQCAAGDGYVPTAGAAARPLAVLFADVDRFKEINDRYGHATGDGVLRAVAHVLGSVTRGSQWRGDLSARVGGDEFVVLLPEAGPEGADQVAGRIRRALRERPPGPVPFTMSIGTAVVDPCRPQPLDGVLAAADAAMYQEKAGKASLARTPSGPAAVRRSPARAAARSAAWASTPPPPAAGRQRT